MTDGYAISRVFWIPEIFEQILLHLDICDILRIRSANRYLNALIASPQLQRKIHKLPETPASNDSDPLFCSRSTVGNVPKLSNGEDIIDTYEAVICGFVNSALGIEDFQLLRGLSEFLNTEVCRDHWIWSRDPAYHRFCFWCLRCHTKFENELIHPLFHNFMKLNVCISGRGSELLMTVRLDYFYHLVLLPGYLGMLIYGLRDIIAEFQRMTRLTIKYDLKWDILTRPLCKTLVDLVELRWAAAVRSKGVTVSLALAILGTCLESYTRAARDNATAVLTTFPAFDPRRTLLEVLIREFMDAHSKLEDTRRDWEIWEG